MTSPATAARTSLATQPSPWFVTGLGIAASLAASLGHLSPTASAVVFSLATATGTIITAALARPVAVTAIGGAATMVLGDLALFGLHLSPDAIGALVAALTFALGMALHVTTTPTAAPLPARVTAPQPLYAPPRQ